MKKKIEIIVKHAEVSEKAIESYLVKKMKELGLTCLKYSNMNMAGYPDRIVLLPCGEVIWVELKSKGKKQSKLQQGRTDELENLDHTVLVLDSKDGVDILCSVLKMGREDGES